jgi:branched-chain amino acid aminotransferase
LTSTIYLNGAFVDEREAKVSVYDGGWLHGAGLFETMRAEDGCVFKLESHIERLRRSAAELLAPMERDALPIAAVFAELLKRNNLQTARVRLTVSAGPMREGSGTSTALRLTVCATAAELSSYPRDFYEKGVGVVICPFRTSPSDPIAGHKTTGYLPRLLGLRRAQQALCVEALWFTTGNRLAEGSISNVFAVRDGVLKTPPLDTPVLPGIARGVVIDIARQAGIEAHECPLSIDDLLDADEVFLTNAIMQVMPVRRVEKHDIRDARVGPMTRRLLAEYCECVRRECGGE